MINKKSKSVITILLFLFSVLISVPSEGYVAETEILSASELTGMALVSWTNDNQQVSLDRIASSIQSLSLEKNNRGLQNLADSLVRSLGNYSQDSAVLSELFYYIGVCESITMHVDALRWLERTVEFKERLGLTDEHYAKCIYNIGVVYNYRGDFRQVCRYMLKYIAVATHLYGENSSQVALGYCTLIGASVESQDYNKFPDYTFTVLGILGRNKTALTGIELSDLYHNIGIGYVHTGDYAKARIYLEEAEALRKKHHMDQGEDYINLINTLAVAYGYLGLADKELEYFNRGIEMAVKTDSYLAFNMINTYVIGLGNSGNIRKGEILLSGLVEKSRSVYGSDSRYYIEALRNYAEYLMDYEKDYSGSVKLFDECIRYLGLHKEDITLNNFILTGYAEALYRNGEPVKALGIIQKLLFDRDFPGTGSELYDNPSPDSLKKDKKTLKVLRLKYEILRSIYSASNDQNVLKAAAATSEMMISLIDNIRMNISEEESRILLGDRYRDSYLLAIRDFELCFRKTGDPFFLKKAFEFAERSKVAGLLAATRELNAIQFRVPADIADFESSLMREIGFYNSRIALENDKATPDKNLISGWKTKLLAAIKVRDSLVMTFERDYPGYYSIKYMNTVPSVDEIPSIIGKNSNYLNYIVSDSVLYIFLVNRKHQQILTCKIDSLFFSQLRRFRLLLSDRNASFNAWEKFTGYQEISFELYKTLIDPVRKYFISKNLIISPDNILSYLPFETMISSKYPGEEILYRKLNYLMNDYSISYNYSASYMEEIEKREPGKTNDLVAFAPIYTRSIRTDSLFMNRKAGSMVLYDLPFARQEAEYITQLTGGHMFLNNEAKESVFKSEAGRYGIIHLAMHTYLNDQYPMNSAMIFAQIDDRPEDGLLYTYEVYGIPLRARMVVLSSCNTGTGTLSSGEGILSLARGFLYSGSRSVIMSMWEVEDKSGTDITELFYSYLKKGKSKSEALKKTRNEYLKNASQLKSHPYFWSTLVIYGDNSPLYVPWRKIISALSFLIAVAVMAGIYCRKRKYS